MRTIVVWKQEGNPSSIRQRLAGCVRTIVVWKRIPRAVLFSYAGWLRENHSGMQTSLTSYELVHVGHVLRENHSGMETFPTLHFPTHLPTVA